MRRGWSSWQPSLSYLTVEKVLREGVLFKGIGTEDLGGGFVCAFV